MSRIDRRAQITSAALELFKLKGFADVSTRDLANHAGLSRSHLYHYFKDWNDLRLEAFLRFSSDQLEEVRGELKGFTGADATRAFVRCCLPTESDSEWMLWLDAWDEAMHDPEMAEAHLRVNRQWQDMLAQTIEQGVSAKQFQCASPERAARQLLALTWGYGDELMLRPSEKAAEAAFAEVMEVADLLLGVRAAA